MAEDERPAFERTIVVRKRNRWILGIAALPAVLAVALGAGSAEASPPVFLLFCLGALAFGGAIARNPSPTLVEQRVVVEPDALVVGDRRIERRAIRDAQLIPARSGAGYAVRVKKAVQSLELTVASREDGLALLHALGFGASQKVARFWTMSYAGSYLVTQQGVAVAVAAMFMFVAVLLSRHAFAAPAMVTLVGLVMVAMAIPTAVDVGADGVSIRWLWHRTFVPHGKILKMAVSAQGTWNQRYTGVALTLEGGSELWLPTARGSSSTGDEQALALMERIREAQELKGGADAVATAAFLDRGSRGVGEWIARLRALGACETADLRTAPLGAEELWRVVESSLAAPSARAAAAVALASSLDQDGKARLRVAKDAVADTRLRVVLDAATTGDEKALEEALGEMADTGAEEKAQRR